MALKSKLERRISISESIVTIDGVPGSTQVPRKCPQLVTS